MKVYEARGCVLTFIDSQKSSTRAQPLAEGVQPVGGSASQKIDAGTHAIANGAQAGVQPVLLAAEDVRSARASSSAEWRPVDAADIAGISPMPTRAGLIETAGRPKTFLWIFNRSKPYREVLARLDDHHAALAKPYDRNPTDYYRDLRTSLVNLQTAAEAYVAPGGNRTRRNDIRPILKEARTQIARIDELLADHVGKADWPERKHPAEILEKRMMGILPREIMTIEPYEAMGLDVEDARHLIGEGISPERFGEMRALATSDAEALLVLSQGLTKADLQPYLHLPLGDETPLLIAADLATNKVAPDVAEKYLNIAETSLNGAMLAIKNVPLELAALYKDYKLKPVDAALVGDLTPPNLRGASVLGAGNLNKVYDVAYRLPNGAIVRGVYKPLQAVTGHTIEFGGASEASGVDIRNPQTAMRNLATSAVADLFGFEVVPRTEIAHTRRTKNGVTRGELGLFMTKAEGRPAQDMPRGVTRNGEVLKEVMKLQLLDHVTGQVDRHWNNYFVAVRPDGSATVTGIDNDQCFGNRLLNPEDIAVSSPLGRVLTETGGVTSAFRGTRLPPVVDSEALFAVMNVTPDDLRAAIGEMLLPSEVEAAVSRLVGLQAHLGELQRAGRVIDEDRWDAPAVRRLLNKVNSYVGRDLR